ncbi:hypothetical protein DPEC_G00305200 [Dallia pectoralis]|uniref:Uncharacterized protein n=1 Tax=Dallia pectoralis TaxID=75939 RepID=A0ACC2FDS8_DALPE|nr:hypothetical protein DPEC_G00305200 [Dallia pectoralis]
MSRESTMTRSTFTGELLVQYISETLCHIETVKEFCVRHSKWLNQRKTELEMMKDIKTRFEQINLNFNHVVKSETKFKAFKEFVQSQRKTDRKLEELEEELEAVLKDTLDGMEKLDDFIDAVECLAVTCLSVFEEKQFLRLFPDTIPALVQAVITDARNAYHLLIHFKRDAKAFFIASFFNVEVLACYLDRYIQTSKQLCNSMEKGSTDCWKYWKNYKTPVVNLGKNVSEESLQKMLQHLKQLSDIRMDPPLRMTLLFGEKSLHFIGRFHKCRPRMEQFLTELEESAVMLDRMKKGAKISSVAGSSVGVTGGILSIVGLALMPVTAGVSVGLTIAGVSLGVTSGVNSITTGVTEMLVNKTNEKKANEVFENFMKDVKRLQECLEDVDSDWEPILGGNGGNGVLVAGKVISKVGAIGKGIDSIVDCASCVKVLRTQNLLKNTGMVALQEGQAARNLPKLIGDIPEVGQFAKGTQLALSSSARAGFITLNALFIGLDVFFICKDSINLAKGSKSEIAQIIRARLALWRRELESWQMIYDLLCRGIFSFQEGQKILEQSFYPLE